MGETGDISTWHEYWTFSRIILFDFLLLLFLDVACFNSYLFFVAVAPHEGVAERHPLPLVALEEGGFLSRNTEMQRELLYSWED